MTALAIVFAVLVLIALLPVGGAVEYGEDGLSAHLIIGPARILLYPRAKKPKKEKRGKPPKAKKPKKVKEKPEEADVRVKKGGKLPMLWQLLQLGLGFLGDMRRKLLVRELTVYFTYGGAEPAETAVRYGKTCAAAHAVMPLFHRLFRVRKQDVRIIYDAAATEITVCVRAAITIRIGQMIALAVRYGVRALKILLAQRKNKNQDDKAVSQ